MSIITVPAFRYTCHSTYTVCVQTLPSLHSASNTSSAVELILFVSTPALFFREVLNPEPARDSALVPALVSASTCEQNVLPKN
jgi:hypothetical protein